MGKRTEIERACEAMQYAPGFVPAVENFCFDALCWLKERCTTMSVTCGRDSRWMVAVNVAQSKGPGALEIEIELSVALARAVLAVSKGEPR